MDASPSPHDPPFSSYEQISCKTESQMHQNRCLLYSTNSKTSITAVSSKWKEINKLNQKNVLTSKGILEIRTVPKFSQKYPILPYPYVKFEVKNDGDFTEHVRPTVLELCRNLVRKWVPDPTEMVPPNF